MTREQAERIVLSCCQQKTSPRKVIEALEALGLLKFEEEKPLRSVSREDEQRDLMMACHAFLFACHNGLPHKLNEYVKDIKDRVKEWEQVSN